MLKNLGDIFKYTSEKLLSGELDSIDDIIEYLEECQQLISEKEPLEAPILTISLQNNSITLPSDFMKLKKIVINDAEVEPVQKWNNVITIPIKYSSGEAKLFYFRKPTPLDPFNLNQIPDIDPKYYSIMAKYAAKMYYLVDDDEDMMKSFKDSFFESLTMLGSKQSNKQSNYKNLW